MTFLELLVTLIIGAILTVIAVPMFGGSTPDCDNPNARQGPLMRSKIAKVTGDLGRIHLALGRFEVANKRYPATLAEAGLGGLRDPWGNPYRYLVVLGRNDVGPVRKDNNLKPVNSAYDVYSMGADGRSETPFTSNLGRDDVVMAGDGDYFGLACQYTGSGK